MLVALLGVATVLYCLWWYWPRKAPVGSYWPTMVPGLTSFTEGGNLPGIGGLYHLVMQRNRILFWFYENTLKYNSWFLQTPHLGTLACVRDAESVEYILKTNFDNFPKG